MRSDYILYGLAVIFFIITAAVLTYQVEQQSLWIVTTAVLGLLFIGLGYSQKPKSAIAPHMDPVSSPIMTTPIQTLAEAPPPQPTVAPEPSSEPSQLQVAKPEVPSMPAAPTIAITQVKGVKEKRAEQLRELGINTIQELADASPEKIGKSLQLSPKITAKWVEHAKQLTEKS
jgi:predicted flap endonuclease-1-like 5' DNA nuclease